MSLAKSWKVLPLLAVLAIALTGCAGSKSSTDGYDGGSTSSDGGSSGGDNGGGNGGGSNGGSGDGVKAAPKEEINEDKLKDAQTDATKVEEQNHDLRRQIFDAKNKLGIPVEQPAEE